MVLLHVKQKDERQFLFEAPARDCVDTVIRDLVVVNNLQIRILGMKEEAKRLALYGPAKHPDDDEDSDDEASMKKGKQIRGPHYNKDPHCRRTGEGRILLILFQEIWYPQGTFQIILQSTSIYPSDDALYTTDQADEIEDCESTSVI